MHSPLLYPFHYHPRIIVIIDQQTPAIIHRIRHYWHHYFINLSLAIVYQYYSITAIRTDAFSAWIISSPSKPPISAANYGHITTSQPAFITGHSRY